MKFNELQTSRSRKSTRVGRGIAGGKGKTAGRGTKGQRSRAGSGKKPGFEGGQNPIMQRLPKLPGFRSFRTSAEVVYTGQLNGLGTKVTNATLAEAGLVSNAYTSVKLVVKGEVTKKVAVELQNASARAIDAVEKAGGTFTKVDRQPRPAKADKKSK